jgi:hypothetical protein
VRQADQKEKAGFESQAVLTLVWAVALGPSVLVPAHRIQRPMRGGSPAYFRTTVQGGW